MQTGQLIKARGLLCSRKRKQGMYSKGQSLSLDKCWEKSCQSRPLNLYDLYFSGPWISCRDFV